MAQNIILWDGMVWDQLLPFTFTRPAGEIRCGILTLSEKYEKYSGSKPSFLTRPYLRKKYPAVIADDNLIINAAILPDQAFYQACSNLEMGQCLYSGETFLATR